MEPMTITAHTRHGSRRGCTTRSKSKRILQLFQHSNVRCLTHNVHVFRHPGRKELELKSYIEPPIVVEPPTMVKTETRHNRKSSTQPPSMTSRLNSTGITAQIRMRRFERLHGGVGSQVSSSSKPIVIDLAAPEFGPGVRCFWGLLNAGGIQFRVSDHPQGYRPRDNAKAPVEERLG